MKPFFFILGTLFALLTNGQTQPVLITTGQTTSLIFPFPIRHVDRGTKDILIQPVKEAKHILLVKAAASNFTPTNLSVITEDGQLYSFAVSYAEAPPLLVYTITPSVIVPVASTAQGLLDNRRILHGPRVRSFDMGIQVDGIYSRDNVIYYQLHLHNTGSIDYDVDFLRCYLRDREQPKRTAQQEQELKPLYIAGNAKVVHGRTCTELVIALDKFTIEDKKLFAIELHERRGGRHLLLELKNRHILRATPLPRLQ